MSRIFLSHSSSNNAQALALAAWLEQQGWSDYFLDIDEDRGIAPGERWMAALTGAVDRCEAVLFLVSEESSFIVGTALFVDGGCTTMMPGNT